MRPGRSEIALLVALLVLAVYARLHHAGAGVATLSPLLIVAVAARVVEVALTYWLGRRTGGPGVGLPAAFFLAVAGPHPASTIMSTGDWAGSGLLLGLLALFRVQERCAWRAFAGAGLGIGLAGGLVWPCFAVAALIWLADGLRPANLSRARDCAPTFAQRGVLPAAAGLLIGGVIGWAVQAGNPLGLLGLNDSTGPTVDVWTALGASLGSGLLALALAGGAVALLRRSPKGVLLAGAALLVLPVPALWPLSGQSAVAAVLPILALLGALALRTTVGSLLSPALAQARALTLNSRSDLVRALTAGRVLRLLGPLLLTLGALLLTMPLWTPLLP
ncbi:MAG: hypothetical protein M3Z04_11985 [Chloroflexota bacterium]|nr:hypothetical protein [Chloroflexota bacterium]